MRTPPTNAKHVACLEGSTTGHQWQPTTLAIPVRFSNKYFHLQADTAGTQGIMLPQKTNLHTYSITQILGTTQK